MRIRVLDDRLVDRIAAGEVVDRPASVVKELVENSLDAEATRVRVALRGGGRTLIRVVDDGVGMEKDDAVLCLSRHATSKIRTEEDLARVATLGFRGEAIPSIASVSKFSILTRPRGAEVGTRVVVDGGELRDVTPAGCAVGTEIDVRSLFHPVPVRRKFLRSAATELGHCVEAVLRVALARPDVAFELTHDDREIYRFEVGNPAKRVADALGADGRALVPVEMDEDGVRAVGFASPVGVHRATATGASYLYVNGRFVRDAVVRRAVAEAYRGLVPKGRHPIVVLDVRVDPDDVDVNVHPSKIEVRFRDPRTVESVVALGLRAALEAHGIRRPVEVERGPSVGPPSRPAALPLAPPRADGALPFGRPAPAFTAPRPPSLPAHPADDPRLWRPRAAPPHDASSTGDAHADEPFDAATPDDPGAPASIDAPFVAAEPTRASFGGDPLLPVPRYRDLRVVGQLANTYLVCEGGQSLVLVDQHAAHERVMLHRLLKDRREHLGASQRLLSPKVVDLPRAHAEALAARLDVLETANLEIEAVGPGRFAIRGVPTSLERADVVALVRDVAEELASDGAAAAHHDVTERVLATMACHSAVRANEPLTPYEMQALLAALDEVDHGVCAHGRPVLIRFDRVEIERRFHRT